MACSSVWHIVMAAFVLVNGASTGVKNSSSSVTAERQLYSPPSGPIFSTRSGMAVQSSLAASCIQKSVIFGTDKYIFSKFGRKRRT